MQEGNDLQDLPYLDNNNNSESLTFTQRRPAQGGIPNKEIMQVYLEVASQIGGAGQSACCLNSLNGSVSHMTHTGGGGFCYSGLDSLGGDKPKHKEQKRGEKRKSEQNNCQGHKVSALKYKNNLNDSVKVKRAKQSHTLGINSSLPDYCFSYN